MAWDEALWMPLFAHSPQMQEWGLCEVYRVDASLTLLSSWWQVDGEAILKAEGHPLLTVELQLAPPEACFEPPLSGGSVSVRASFQGWLQAYLGCAHLVSRLTTDSGSYSHTSQHSFLTRQSSH